MDIDKKRKLQMIRRVVTKSAWKSSAKWQIDQSCSIEIYSLDKYISWFGQIHSIFLEKYILYFGQIRDDDEVEQLAVLNDRLVKVGW